MILLKTSENAALLHTLCHELFLMAALPLLLNWSARFSAAISWLACLPSTLAEAGSSLSLRGSSPIHKTENLPYGKMFVLCCHEPTILGSEGRRVFSLELKLLAPLELFNFCLHYKVIYSSSWDQAVFHTFYQCFVIRWSLGYYKALRNFTVMVSF